MTAVLISLALMALFSAAAAGVAVRAWRDKCYELEVADQLIETLSAEVRALRLEYDSNYREIEV